MITKIVSYHRIPPPFMHDDDAQVCGKRLYPEAAPCYHPAMTSPAHPLLAEYLDRFGALAPDPLCPEIRAWNARDFDGLWKRARELDEHAPVPYWGIVWPGGRGMARFILDNGKLFRGRRVIDLGSGSGITAVAAAMAGARVTGVDIDPPAAELAEMTAAANGATCEFRHAGVADIGDDELGQYDIILAGDIFNAKEFAEGVISLARRGLEAGLRNYLADSGRSHRPRNGVEVLSAMRVPVFREIEGVTERDVKVFSVTG